MCFEKPPKTWLFETHVAFQRLSFAAGAVQLRGTLLQGIVIAQKQVAQVQGEGGAAVISERISSFAGLGAEGDNVVCLRQGGNQVRGGFVAVLVAGQNEVARFRVLVSSTGRRSSGVKVSLEDVLNTAHQLIIGQRAVCICQRHVDTVQSLVGVLTREVSGGEHVAGQQVRLSGGEGAARLTQGGQQKPGQEGVQGLGGVRDSLLQVLLPPPRWARR